MVVLYEINSFCWAIHDTCFCKTKDFLGFLRSVTYGRIYLYRS